MPGLAEKRPSVLVGTSRASIYAGPEFTYATGDVILVQPHGSDAGRWFEGHVHVVRKEEVGLCFHGSFRSNPSTRYTVRFKLNRIPLRRQHQALDAAFHPGRLLFPTNADVQGPRASRSAVEPHIYNRLIVGNDAQLQAVASIANQRPRAAPFVIFGPYVYLPAYMRPC